MALKILPPAFAEDPERLARFRREAQVLAHLNHPNIGAIYGLEEAEDIGALVTIDGGEYAEWSPESDRLFFVWENALYGVDVETGDGLRLSLPRQVIDGAEHGLQLARGIHDAPGADRIIAVQTVEQEGEERPAPKGILAVQNWTSEFRGR